MFIFFLVGVHESLGSGAGIIGAVMVGKVGVVQGFGAGNFYQLGAVPAIAAYERHIQADFPGLFHDLTNFFVITGYIDNLRFYGCHLGQHGLKVCIFLQIGFFDDDTATFGGKSLLEAVGQTFGIVAAVIDEDSGFLEFQGVSHEVGAHGALEGVDEADPVGVGFYLVALIVHGNLGVGGAYGQERNLGSFADIGSGNGAGRSEQAQYGRHFILVYQLAHGVGGFRRFRFGIGYHELYLFS